MALLRARIPISGGPVAISRFVAGKSLISRFIQWFTWGDYGHVEHVLRDGSVISAEFWSGVTHYPVGHPVPKGSQDFTVELTDDQCDRLESFLRAQVGKGYDWSALLGFVARSDWQARSRWFCSELEAAAYQAAGKPLLRTDVSYRVSPSMLSLSPYLTPSG